MIKTLSSRLSGAKVGRGIALTTGIFGLFLLMQVPSQASPMGTLAVGQCSGGGVQVNATMITWLPAQGGGGCIETGFGTSVTYTGGTLSSGVTGTVLNLSGSFPSGFMTFSGTPLTFDLGGLGPGSSNTNCAAVTVIGDSCSAASTSPFLLTLSSTGTTVTLTAFGTASDGTGPSSTWSGSFSTPILLTPVQIQTLIGGGGTISSSYGGLFDVTLGATTPEPSSWLLFGLGLGSIGLGMVWRRKSNRGA